MGDMGDRYIRMEDTRRLEIISLSPLDFLVGGDLGEDGAGRTMHWIQDNFVFGQNSKSLLVFINGPVRSFGTFYATFEKQNGDFLIPSVKKVNLKNRKNEKMAQNG